MRSIQTFKHSFTKLVSDGCFTFNLKTMSKPNHNADMKNPNKGNPGQNKTHAANQGNRGKQMNPNQGGGKKK